MQKLVLLLALLILFFTLEGTNRWQYTALSAALPGSGELLMGKTQRGIALLSADILVWSFFLKSANDMRDLQRTYKQYAYQYAGVPLDRDSGYYQVIQNYISSNEFNQLQEMLARNYFILTLNDQQAYQEYIDNNTYTGEFGWQWENIQNWHHYKSLRRKHRITQMENQIFVGLLILNRLVSVINVNLLFNRSRVQSSLFFSAASPDQVMLNYQIKY